MLSKCTKYYEVRTKDVRAIKNGQFLGTGSIGTRHRIKTNKTKIQHSTEN
jgi:hypothetical protein